MVVEKVRDLVSKHQKSELEGTLLFNLPTGVLLCQEKDDYQ